MERTRPAYDEMYADDARVRPHYAAYSDWLVRQPDDALRQKRAEADSLFHRVGITFAVYGEQEGNERLIPFDIVPRILSASEWRTLAAGLEQRVRALNAFIADIYHGQDILRAGLLAPEQIFCNPQYRPEMQDMDVPGGIYAHIAGIDVVRAGHGEFYVLEDNLRVPSGVSYMLEDRKMMMRLFPELFSLNRVAPVEHYPDRLFENLSSVAPAGVADPVVVVLTPGANNSAYFEHAFLAQQMGVELVEGQDLFVREGFVYMRTTRGPQRVDVIYRRIDDDFLDPLVFRPDSVLGVPGLMSAYREGRVTVANAMGTGIADDKSIYPYVPDMIRFYLGEAAAAGQRADAGAAPSGRPRLHARAPRRAGRQGSPRFRRLRHAGRADGVRSRAGGLPAADPRLAREVHRAADARAVDLPDVRRAGRGPATHRPASVRAVRPRGQHRARAASRASRCAPARWW